MPRPDSAESTKCDLVRSVCKFIATVEQFSRARVLRSSIKLRATPPRGTKGRSANAEPQWRTRSGNQAERNAGRPSEAHTSNPRKPSLRWHANTTLPHRLRHLSATVLQCLRHGVWGGGSGARQQCRAPRAIPEHLRPRRDPHNALRGPGATTKLESAPPRCVGGDCGWAGRAGEPLLGAMGYTDRVDDMPPVTGGKSTNCGSGARPQRL
jgi:hypothetical protein